jgi:hypothetical protein
MSNKPLDLDLSHCSSCLCADCVYEKQTADLDKIEERLHYDSANFCFERGQYDAAGESAASIAADMIKRVRELDALNTRHREEMEYWRDRAHDLEAEVKRLRHEVNDA